MGNVFTTTAMDAKQRTGFQIAEMAKSEPEHVETRSAPASLTASLAALSYPARSVLCDLRVLCDKTFLFTFSEIVRTCDDFLVNMREQDNDEARSNDSDENTRFNGAELSES